MTDVVAMGAGGLTAHKLSKGDPLVTAAGAGLLLGETLDYANDVRARKAYTTGFDKGAAMLQSSSTGSWSISEREAP